MELRQNYPLTEILQVVDLPRSVYYYHVNRKEPETDSVLEEIKNIKQEHKDYGYRRVTLELKNRKMVVNHKKVQRLMQENNLQANAYNIKIKKYNSYKGRRGKVAPNRLNQRFKTDRPCQKLTADITELRWGNKTTAERAYFQPLYDLYNDEVLAFNIGLSPTVDFAVKPLKAALENLPELAYRTTVHTDQGFHYQNKKWTKVLKEHKVIQSMSRKGNCLDNASMESFFSIMKKETVYSKDYATFEELEAAITSWISYYNEKRIKGKLGGKSPIQYRLLMAQKIAQ